jgi:hypothetical protein
VTTTRICTSFGAPHCHVDPTALGPTHQQVSPSSCKFLPHAENENLRIISNADLHTQGKYQIASGFVPNISVWKIVTMPESDEKLGAVWMAALGATPRLRCGGRFGRHTCGTKCVAWHGVLGRHPNSPWQFLCSVGSDLTVHPESLSCPLTGTQQFIRSLARTVTKFGYRFPLKSQTDYSNKETMARLFQF